VSRTMTVQDSIVVDADPMTIYQLVADPSQMPRWSPENTAGDVPEPGSPATVGTTFVGSNKRGFARWQTRCRVTVSDPGERFAFDVFQIGLRTPFVQVRIASWAYEFEPVDGGTKVTETWTDGRRRWPDAMANTFDKIATGGRTFADFQCRNIAKTLANLKADLES
jgi:polyketide cyclase/dehydrase/lipid transport protein